MSIIAMLALTAWVTDFIQVSVGSDSAVVLAYADNWAFLANNIQDLRTGLDAMEKTVTAWKMQISTDKSWAWATHARQRSELATLCLNGCNIPIKLVSEELGCDVSYCRRISKKVSQKRISKASRIMKRVATKKLPRKFKTVMSKQLVGGIAGYGSELVYHTVSDLRVLRTAVCNGLGRSRAGNNPYLATLVTQGVYDLAPTLLLRKMIFWRRFFRIFPSQRDRFLQMLAEGTHRMGATAFLRRTLLDHGWKCLNGGLIQHERG